MSVWKYMVGPVVATYFAWNEAWNYVVTSEKRHISGNNGQIFRFFCSACKVLQNNIFLCGTGHCHTHACEALVTPSATTNFARRLVGYVLGSGVITIGPDPNQVEEKNAHGSSTLTYLYHIKRGRLFAADRQMAKISVAGDKNIMLCTIPFIEYHRI